MERDPLGSTRYLEEDYRAVNRGEAPPFFSRPYSKNKSSRYRESEEPFYLHPDLGLSLRLQHRWDDIRKENESYHYNEWLKNTPLIMIGFQTGNENFVIDSQFDLRHDFFSASRADSYTNFPLTLQDLDFNFPTRGYIAYGNKNLQLLMGRDRIRFGPGQRSNLLLSSTVPYFDQINLSYENPVFKGTFLFIPLESFLTGEEKDTMAAALEDELTPDGNFGKDLKDQTKFLTGHRYEFRFGPNFLISFTDLLVVGGRFPNFEDIPPTMFYHNVYGENYSNVIIGFDFFWTIIPGLALYGEFAIDDINNRFEDSYSVPTSTAVLGGVQYHIPIRRGKLISNLEFGKTDPYSYERWNPYIDFYSRRKLLSTSLMSNRYIDTPTGMFLGSDSLYITGWLDLPADKVNVSGGWEMWRRNLQSHLHGVELIEAYNESPERTYTFTNIVFLRGRYSFNKSVSIDIRENLMISEDVNNLLSLGVNFQY